MSTKRLRRPAPVPLQEVEFVELDGFAVDFRRGTLVIELKDVTSADNKVARTTALKMKVDLLDRFCDAIAAGQLPGDTCHERMLRALARLQVRGIPQSSTIEDKPASNRAEDNPDQPARGGLNLPEGP